MWSVYNSLSSDTHSWSLSSTDPVWSPSHRMQSFLNWSWGLPTDWSSSISAPLLVCTSGFSPWGIDCYNMGPPWVMAPTKSPVGATVGFSPQAVVPAQNLLPTGFSIVCNLPQVICTCSSVGPSPGCSMDICTAMVYHELQVRYIQNITSTVTKVTQSLLASWPCPPNLSFWKV